MEIELTNLDGSAFVGPYGDGLAVAESTTKHLLLEGSHGNGTSAETTANAHAKVQKNGAKRARTEKQKVANYAKKRKKSQDASRSMHVRMPKKDA